MSEHKIKELNGIGDRLREIRVQSALNVSELSRMIGVPYKSISNYERGERKATVEYLALVSEHLGANVEWLLFGKGNMFSTEENSNRNDICSSDYIYIPIYDIQAAAGHGCIVDEETVIDHFAFKADWFNKNICGSKPDLVIFTAHGESMEPTIKNGDLIMIDTANKRIRDGIFVIRFDNSLLVKRLSLMPKDKLQIKSDNPEHPIFEVNLKEEDAFAVIGKVVWHGKNVF
jgi:phage repressor protein C with HTH and peptisase S24 domain